MYKLLYLQKTLDDLEEIHFHISTDSLQAADNVINSILDALDNLEAFPFIGRSVADKLDAKGDYRIIIIKPYLVFYRVISTQVTIYRVLHEKRYYNALFT